MICCCFEKKVVVEDSKKVEAKMNGKKNFAAEFVYQMRVNLFKEHFEMEFEECIDPLDDNMWTLILERSKVYCFFKLRCLIYFIYDTSFLDNF